MKTYKVVVVVKIGDSYPYEEEKFTAEVKGMSEQDARRAANRMAINNVRADRKKVNAEAEVLECEVVW